MAEEKRSATDRIRERLLGGRAGQNDKIVEIDGERYLLVPPKVKQRSNLLDRASKTKHKLDADGEPTGEIESSTDVGELQIGAIIACVRDPETRQLIFSHEDREAFMDSELSSHFDRLGKEALKLINPKIKDVEKNSDGVPGVSPSTASPQS